MRTIKKILVPTDFSPPAHHALDEAVSLARKFDTSITLLHVYGMPQPIPNAEIAYASDVMAALEAVARRDLERERAELLARIPDAPSIELKAVLGFPVEDILATAKRERADVIVMGTHGRTGVRHLVLGSVAERVVREAPIPVFTIREPPAAAPVSLA